MRPPATVFAPAGDEAYTYATRAVTDALEHGTHTPNAHVLAGAAVTAAAPYVQRDMLRRLVDVNAWRAGLFVWLQLTAPALGLLAGVGYATFVAHSWVLAAVQLVALAAMLTGASVVSRAARRERITAEALLTQAR